MVTSLSGDLPLARPLHSDVAHACAGCLNGSCYHRQTETARRFASELGSGGEGPALSPTAPASGEFDLLSMLAPWVTGGQERYRTTIRRLIELTQPDLVPLLDTCAGDPYLEPHAFLHFAAGHTGEGLGQAVLGYAARDRRGIEITVVTDHQGVAFLPPATLIRTGKSNTQLQLNWPADEDRPVVSTLGAPVPFTIEPVPAIAGTSIVLYPVRTPLLDTVFVDLYGEPVPIAIERPAQHMRMRLDHGFALLRDLHPELHRLLLSVLRLVVIFEGEGLNSFATPAAHGAVFINAALGDTEVFLLEELSHQGGHVLFSAATANAPSYFEVSPETPVATFTKHRTDDRSVYVVLHGVVTEALMAQTLDAALSKRVVCGAQLHELQGRLAFTLRRYAADLQTIALPGILNDRGLALLRMLLAGYLDIARSRSELVRQADFSNQAYNFSYSRYAELNPAWRHAL
jgi:hypothetical protein